MLESNPHGLSESVLRDFLINRKRLKAELTETAWNRLSAELDRVVEAGYSAEDAMAEAVTAGWRGVKLDWLKNRLEPRGLANGIPAQQIVDAYHEQCPNLAPVTVIDQKLLSLINGQLEQGGLKVQGAQAAPGGRKQACKQCQTASEKRIAQASDKPALGIRLRRLGE